MWGRGRYEADVSRERVRLGHDRVSGRAPSSSTKWKPSVVQTTHLAIKSLDTGAGFMLNLSKSPECCLNLDSYVKKQA